MEQVDDLLERGVFDEVIDVVAEVIELSGITLDVAQLRLVGVNTFQAAVDDRSLWQGWRGCRCYDRDRSGGRFRRMGVVVRVVMAATGLLFRHRRRVFQESSFVHRFDEIAPISAGVSATMMPASRIAAFFASAVPCPPEIIAPA